MLVTLSLTLTTTSVVIGYPKVTADGDGGIVQPPARIRDNDYNRLTLFQEVLGAP